MHKYQTRSFSYTTKRSLWLGRIILAVWALLVLHYLAVFGLGISFNGLASYFAPFLADLPIFERLRVYYAHDPQGLAQARNFYLVNNGILFPALAMCLINSLADIVPNYEYLKRNDSKRLTESRQTRKGVLSDIFSIVFFSCGVAAVIGKLAGYYELPETGIGRGFMVVLGHFFVIIFFFILPQFIALTWNNLFLYTKLKE